MTEIGLPRPRAPSPDPLVHPGGVHSAGKFRPIPRFLEKLPSAPARRLAPIPQPRSSPVLTYSRGIHAMRTRSPTDSPPIPARSLEGETSARSSCRTVHRLAQISRAQRAVSAGPGTSVRALASELRRRRCANASARRSASRATAATSASCSCRAGSDPEGTTAERRPRPSRLTWVVLADGETEETRDGPGRQEDHPAGPARPGRPGRDPSTSQAAGTARHHQRRDHRRLRRLRRPIDRRDGPGPRPLHAAGPARPDRRRTRERHPFHEPRAVCLRPPPPLHGAPTPVRPTHRRLHAGVQRHGS